MVPPRGNRIPFQFGASAPLETELEGAAQSAPTPPRPSAALSNHPKIPDDTEVVPPNRPPSQLHRDLQPQHERVVRLDEPAGPNNVLDVRLDGKSPLNLKICQYVGLTPFLTPFQSRV